MATISEHLDAAECWRLVTPRTFGRLGFVDGAVVRVVPTHYLLEEHTAYVRVPTFGGLARQAHRQPTSLEVECIEDAGDAGWSVLLSAVAHRVEDAATVARLWPAERAHPWAPGIETRWVALDVDHVDGIRVTRDEGRRGENPSPTAPPPATSPPTQQSTPPPEDES